MAPRNIVDLYRVTADLDRDDECVHVEDGRLRTVSTADMLERTAALCEALAALGVGPGDRVLLMADNRPEWHQTDLAVLALGAVDVPVYLTLTDEQVAFQAADSGAVAAVVDTPERAARLAARRGELPALRHLVQMDGPPVGDALAMEALVAGHRGPEAVARFWERASRPGADDLATIIYTSGTTGRPKGVMLSHGNIVSCVEVCRERVPMSADDVGLEFLPLCHAFERTMGYGYMALGARRGYANTGNVAEALGLVRPTCFATVPRVLEKARAAIVARAEGGSALRRRLFRWAMGVGVRAARRGLEGRPPGASLALAERLVLRKVRAALGGRIRWIVAAGAPVPADLAEFFAGLGIVTLQAYGLTETSPGVAMCGHRPGENRFGSVGKVLARHEVRLAPDGEILVRGPDVFQGYWNLPEATAEAFDEEGFFRTGDIGRLDDDGFLWITDRKKDLIVTAGGKNVAPQPIEEALKRSPYVDAAVVVGDGRPYVAALLSPSEEGLRAWAAVHGREEDDLATLLALPAVRRLYEEAVEEVNASLARFERVRRFRVLDRPLSQEAGDLTPTLKVRRRVVTERLAEVVEALYAAGKDETRH